MFGTPVNRDGHEQDAVEAALDMRKRLDQLNKRFEKKGYPPLSHGIGIHTGPVIAARIGSTDRSAYSLIGDTVNTASRIQGLNKKFKTDILVSKRIYHQLVGEYTLTAKPEALVKGKQNPSLGFMINLNILISLLFLI